MTLRSGAWFQGDDEVALDARVAMAMSGHPVHGSDAPVIGLANSSSDLNPCNQPLDDLVASLRFGIEEVGGVAVQFPVMSLGEDIMKPAAMLYRNLVAMEVEESLRSQPLDGVIVLAAYPHRGIGQRHVELRRQIDDFPAQLIFGLGRAELRDFDRGILELVEVHVRRRHVPDGVGDERGEQEFENGLYHRIWCSMRCHRVRVKKCAKTDPNPFSVAPAPSS